jgi:hypothetical protein
MSQVIFNERSAPSNPSASKVALYADNTANPLVRQRDDNGNDFALMGVKNYSTAAQSPAAATRTYITGTALAIPANKLQVGSCFRWRFNMTKTGAGTATSTFDICVGTAGTTADTARVSFTKPAGTGVIDEAWVDIYAVVRSIGASGVMVGEFVMVHNLSATGHAVIPAVVVNTVSAGFDMTTANLIVGVCITSGASDAITIQIVQSEAWNV